MLKGTNTELKGYFMIIVIISILFDIYFTSGFKSLFIIKSPKKRKNEIEENSIANCEELKDINDKSQNLINNKNEDKDEKNLNKDKNEGEKNIVSKENAICNNFAINIKLVFSFIGRLLFTIYSFYGLFFLYNLFIQYLTSFPIIFFKIEDFCLQIIVSIIYVPFSILISNVIIIPTYEFLSFPFLKYINPLSNLETFNYIFQDKKFNVKEITEKNHGYVDLGLIIIAIIYSVGFFVGLISKLTEIKSIVEIIILSVVYIYYLTIFFCYSYSSLYVIYVIYKNQQIILPEINVLSYSINPIYENNSEGSQDNENKIRKKFFDIRNIIRIILFFLSSCIIIILSFAVESSWSTMIVYLLFNLFIFAISIVLNFSFCCKNNKTLILKKDEKPNHPIILSAIRFIIEIVFFLISLILGLSFLFMKDQQIEDLIDFDNFSNIIENKIDSKYNLLPNICDSFINNIPIYLYIPFMNDAYYYNNINDSNKNSSFDYPDYKKMFFGDEYKIHPVGNLINGSEKVKMIQYDIYNTKDNVNITILSIKGTSHKKDIYIDFQLYMPSIFLNLLSSFNIFGNEMDTFNYKIVEYSLSIPYRFLGQILFVDEYIEELKQAYYENKDNNKFLENIVIVGHSLGGGLSKILGRITKNQAISLSGPGINAFHTRWSDEGNSENFDISFIDLVPDKDLIPRVEVSGGTIYRIICKSTPFLCHNKALSLCETLIMCRSKYYEFYCYKVANLNSQEIKEILKSSDLKINKKKNKK